MLQQRETLCLRLLTFDFNVQEVVGCLFKTLPQLGLFLLQSLDFGGQELILPR